MVPAAVLTAAVLPALPAPLLPALVIAAGVLALLDSGFRFRRPGGVVLLAILEIVAGLLALVKCVGPVHPYVSTTLPEWLLAAAIAVIAVLQLVMRAARRNSLVWLTVLTLVVSAAAAVVAYLG